MKNNEFDKEIKHKLFRTVEELLHPTISKKNISDYKIIINEDMMPIRVFYPKKVSHIENVMIYIHGEGNITECTSKYSEISSKFAINFNNLVISIDYEDYKKLKIEDLSNKLLEIVKYIYNELIDFGIKQENISLIGDSLGASIILMINDKLKVNKQILFYPFLLTKKEIKEDIYDRILLNKINNHLDKKLKKEITINYNDLPNTLIITGNVDPLLEESKEINNLIKDSNLVQIAFGSHGFLSSDDKEINNDYTKAVNDFLLK